jgi:hypothetical protein
LASLGLVPLACGDATGRKPHCTASGDQSNGIVTCKEGYRFKATSTHCQPAEIDPQSCYDDGKSARQCHDGSTC